MTQTFHLLTGEYPPESGGVGAYTAGLAAELARRGCTVHVWCPAIQDGVSDGVQRHQLPDVFAAASRRMLAHALSVAPGAVILQYVPNALGARGANLRFCLWLLRMRRRGADVRVMFHEPYFYFTPGHPLRNGLAIVQRAMALILLRASRVTYLSTERWIECLERYAPRGASWTPLPIPSTLPLTAAPDAISRWRSRASAAPLIGHFGTFGDHVAGELEPLLVALLDAAAEPHVLLVGRRSDAFADAFRRRHPRFRSRVHATGTLVDREAAAALAACDLLVQPYPDGVTTRRTSVMAGLALGVATVTTDGVLTEDIWRGSGAARLAPAAEVNALRDAALELLRDANLRAHQGRAGRQVYETHFSMDRTVERVLRPAGA